MGTITGRKNISKHFVNILEQILYSDLPRATKCLNPYDSFTFRNPEITCSTLVATFS